LLARRVNKRRTVYEDKPYLNAPEVTRAAIGWLEEHGDRPFFLFLNYMDAHAPNAAPGSQGLPFEDESYVSAVHRWQASDVPAEQRSFVNEYDREVIHLDHWLGVLFDYLERSGIRDRTQVVLTADHGEFLGEHEYLGHGKDLFAEIVNVPMVVWTPGAPGGRDPRPVQTPDVFSTILSFLELPIPPGTQGQPMLEVDHPTVSEEYYAPFDRKRMFDRVMRTVRSGEYRYFHVSTGEERLFHLPSDPGEMRNLIAERTQAASDARARLEEWLRRTPEAAPRSKGQAPGAQDIEALKALGYIQ
jgi:arylsulfatase A-like enzyme